jgi:heat shock protein HtpX
MQFIKRIFFFLLTNIAILALLSVVMFVINVFFPGILDAGGGMASILIYAVIFGFAGSFISLWISRWMAKRSYNIVLLTANTAMQDAKLQIVWDTVERISREHSINMPEVGYYESAEPNAFATGATKNSSLVSVSTGLLNQMEKWEIEWVVGHEMAHILNGDMVTLTLIQWVMNTFVIVFSHLAARAVSSFLSRDNEENALGYMAYHGVYMLFQIIFWALAMLVIMWFSRVREYRADLGGAQYTSRAKMVSGLRKLQKINKLIHTEPVDNKMTAFMITEPDSFWSTHPSLENRIRALEENYQLA